MGYTHHYTLQDPGLPLRTEEIARDVERIILASELEIGDEDGNPGSRPTLGPDRIVLNGVQPEQRDALYYPPQFQWNRERNPRAPEGYEFCCTQYLPYDVVVCASLLAIRHHLQDNVTISSDGKFEEPQWQDALRLYRRATGRELPPGFEGLEQPRPAGEGRVF